MTFNRYALYYLPPVNEDWAGFATAWLGRDITTGKRVAQPVVEGIGVAAITETPRRYGLHATLKPPFRLAAHHGIADLTTACARLAASHRPVTVEGLEITRLGRFLALCPVGDASGLRTLAAACVRELDDFRAPLTAAERAQKRGAGLKPALASNLETWGYPYVLDAFRFHITLTAKLPKAMFAPVQGELQNRLGPLLPSPFRVRDIALVGEGEDGEFRLIERFSLSG